MTARDVRCWIRPLSGLSVLLQAVLLDFLVERGAVDVQLLSRLLAIPTIRLQGRQNDLPFGLFKGLMQRHRPVVRRLCTGN